MIYIYMTLIRQAYYQLMDQFGFNVDSLPNNIPITIGNEETGPNEYYLTAMLVLVLLIKQL